MDLKKIKYKYDNLGYVVLKNFITKDKAENIKKNLILYLDEKKSSLSKRNINFTKGNIINSVHDLNDWKFTREIQRNPYLLKIVNTLLNDKPKKFGSELFAKPAKVGLASPSHQDNYYWCIDSSSGLTVWISLDKSSDRNGAIYYYEGSHNLGLLEHEPSYMPGSSQKIKYEKGLSKFKKITPKLNPGDCLIHHCLVVHGSTINKTLNSRIGWTLRYIGKKSKFDTFLKKNYERKLSNQLKSKK